MMMYVGRIKQTGRTKRVLLAAFLIALCCVAGGCGMITGTIKMKATSSGSGSRNLLAFSTSSQSLNSWTCSGIVTIQTQDASGQVYNVSSDTTISLTGTGGMTFYSNASCTNQVTSVTVTAGNSSANVYFMGSLGGTESLIISATNFNNNMQNETVSIKPYTWLGGTSANWNVGSNWKGGSVPTSTKLAIFDNNCTTFCDVVTNGFSPDVGGIAMKSTFTGSLIQSAGDTLTVESLKYTQAAGTFTGSTAGDSVNVWSDFSLTGGTFTATSGTFQFISSSFQISNAAIFNANNGIFVAGADSSGDPNMTFNTGNASFYDYDLHVGGNYPPFTVTGSMNVAHNLLLDSFELCLVGNINVSGNVIQTSGNGTFSCGGTSTITLVGSGGQTVTGSTGMFFPGIVVEGQSGESITFNNEMDVNGDFEYLSGNVTYNSTLTIFGQGGSGDAPETINTGSLSFHAVDFDNRGSPGGITIVGTMNISGDMLLNMNDTSSNNALTGGTIALSGNFSETENAGSSSPLTISFVGSGANTFSDTTGNFIQGDVVVNKPGGSLTFNKTMEMAYGSQSFDLQAGTVSLNSNVLDCTGSPVTVSAGAVLNCNGGCGTGASCGLGLNDLRCSTLTNSGTINP